MESGVKVGAQGLVAQNPSADASLSVRTGAAAAEAAARQAALKVDSDGCITISSAPTKPKPSPAKPASSPVVPDDEKALTGKKCIAVWAADGGKYPATITKVLGNGMVEVSYTGYPDKANVKIKDIIVK